MDYASEAYHCAYNKMRQKDIDKYGEDVYNQYLKELEAYKRDEVNTNNCKASLWWEGSPTTIGPAPTLESVAKKMGKTM